MPRSMTRPKFCKAGWLVSMGTPKPMHEARPVSRMGTVSYTHLTLPTKRIV